MKKPRISFRIALAKLTNENWAFLSDSPRQRHSDIYVFAVYTPSNKEQNILDMELWDFFIICTSVLDEKFKTQRTVSLSRLTEIDVKKTSFKYLCREISSLCKIISESNMQNNLN